MGLNSTLPDFRLIASRMRFSTRAVCAQRMGGMSSHPYIRSVQGAAKGSTLLSAQQEIAGTFVSGRICIIRIELTFAISES
jgi:hypothetical protein